MQFQIPQFIDVENKIVGPLSLRQFLYLAGAGAISFMLFFVLQMWLWFLVTVFLTIIALALALIKYNGQPLPKILWLALGFLWKPRLYLWQREIEEKIVKIPQMPKFSSLPKTPQRISMPYSPINQPTPTLKEKWDSTESVISKREKLKTFFSEMPNVKKLWQDLLTTKNPVPQREKTAKTPFWGKKPTERFQVFRKITGEKDIARRIDYR
ncbi:MAG: PrgI family protein [Patescibacteria group bacterium]